MAGADLEQVLMDVDDVTMTDTSSLSNLFEPINNVIVEVVNEADNPILKEKFTLNMQDSLNSIAVSEPSKGKEKSKRSYVCEDCGFQCTTSKQFSRHKQRFHENVQHKCDHCGKFYVSKE